MAEFPRGTTTPHTFAEDEHRDLARGIDCSEQGFIRPCERNQSAATSPYIEYTFTPPGGRPVAGDDIVGRDDWTSLLVGAPITIRYVSSDPGINEIGSGTPAPLGDLVFALPISVGLLLSFVGGRLFLFARAEARLRARLLRVGVSAVGTVVNPKVAVAFFSQRPYQRLSYGYADQSGQAWTGVSDWLPIGLAHTWKVGATGHVRYDPAKPAQSYWFGAADPAGT